MNAARLIVRMDFDFQAVRDLSTVKDNGRLYFDEDLTDGTGNLQVKNMWHDSRVVSSASPNDDLDMTGVLTNVFGDGFNETAIKVLIIVNNSATSGDYLLVGGAGAVNNAWSPPFGGNQDYKVRCGPGSVLVLSDLYSGYAVTAGSQDVLRVAYD